MEVAIFGAVAAGTSIVKYAVDYARECYRAYGHCRRLQQDRILDQSQAQDLRTCFEDLADVLDMYDEEVERAVSFKHKKKIGRLLAKIYDNLALFKKDIERFENIVKSGVPGDDDIKILREELRNIRATLVDQKATFLGCVSISMLHRRLSSTSSVPSDESRGSENLTRRDSDTSIETTDSTCQCRSIVSVTGSAKSERQQRLRDYIKSNNDPQYVRSLIEDGQSNEEITSLKTTALLISCQYRKQNLVSDLLEYKAQLQGKKLNGVDAVHLTIGNDLLIVNKEQTILNILKKLENHGVSLNEIDETQKQRRPLHYCASSGKVEVAKYLLKTNDNIVDQIDGEGKTALCLALSEKPDARMVELLLKKGASTSMVHEERLDSMPSKMAWALVDQHERPQPNGRKGSQVSQRGLWKLFGFG